jgi:hypothetical protein
MQAVASSVQNFTHQEPYKAAQLWNYWHQQKVSMRQHHIALYERI